jgi:hypothetical protein
MGLHDSGAHRIIGAPWRTLGPSALLLPGMSGVAPQRTPLGERALSGAHRAGHTIETQRNRVVLIISASAVLRNDRVQLYDHVAGTPAQAAPAIAPGGDVRGWWLTGVPLKVIPHTRHQGLTQVPTLTKAPPTDSRVAVPAGEA